MSWWNSSGISSFASQALKTAQKRIDKVLDIRDEGDGEDTAAEQTVDDSASQSKGAGGEVSPAGSGSDDTSNFWATYLGAEPAPTGFTSTPARSKSVPKPTALSPVASSVSSGSLSASDFKASATSAFTVRSKRVESTLQKYQVKTEAQEDATVRKEEEVVETPSPPEGRPTEKGDSPRVEETPSIADDSNRSVSYSTTDTTRRSSSNTESPGAADKQETVAGGGQHEPARKSQPLRLGSKLGKKKDEALAKKEAEEKAKAEAAAIATQVEDLLETVSQAPSVSDADVKAGNIREAEVSLPTQEVVTVLGETKAEKIPEKEQEQEEEEKEEVGSECKATSWSANLQPSSDSEVVVPSEASGWEEEELELEDLPDELEPAESHEGDTAAAAAGREALEGSRGEGASTAGQAQTVEDPGEHVWQSKDGGNSEYVPSTESLSSKEEEQGQQEETVKSCSGELQETGHEQLCAGEDRDKVAPDGEQVDQGSPVVDLPEVHGEGTAAAASAETAPQESAAGESDKTPTVPCPEGPEGRAPENEELLTPQKLQLSFDGSESAVEDELSESSRTLTGDDFRSSCQEEDSLEDTPRATQEDTPSREQEQEQEQEQAQSCSLTESQTASDQPSADVPAGMASGEGSKEERDGAGAVAAPGGDGSSDGKKASGPLVSSSYVKTMLEEAMVESVKDTDDSRSSSSSSEKSSEMVRIESGLNSGHTSGDEVDTTTSSDIEIISTPTPNGEYRHEHRPFDLSPLRHALSRSMRRGGSPPGHKRSDSSSSGHSTWSKNGDDLLSPDGACAAGATSSSAAARRDSDGLAGKEARLGEEEEAGRGVPGDATTSGRLGAAGGEGEGGNRGKSADEADKKTEGDPLQTQKLLKDDLLPVGQVSSSPAAEPQPRSPPPPPPPQQPPPLSSTPSSLLLPLPSPPAHQLNSLHKLQTIEERAEPPEGGAAVGGGGPPAPPPALHPPPPAPTGLSDQSPPPPPPDLSQRLAEMAEVLDAREKKLVELSRENIDLHESKAILQNQLKQSEEAREAELEDLNTLTEEFTTRISDFEQRLQGVIRERDTLRKQLAEAQNEIMKKSSSSMGLEKFLKEKDQQISELLEEGEKLSKQQLQSNNIIKKLRAKEKDNDAVLKSLRQKSEQQTEEVNHLKKVLDSKEQVEKKQIEAINQQNIAVKKQESELAQLRAELEDTNEKARGLQAALDNSYKEISELHRANAAAASETETAKLSVEMHARQELQVVMERQQQTHKQQTETLLTQIEDLQLSLVRQEREQGRREDVLRQEISDLQQRLQEAEERNQDLTQSVTSATRPLLRQLENLQTTYAAQSGSYEKVEKNLTDRLTEAQTTLAEAVEKERASTERLMDVMAKLTSLETQVSTLRQEKSRLQAQLEVEKTKVMVLEDAKNSETAQFELLKTKLNKEINELKKEKLMLENQYEMEKMKVEAEKKKVVLAHEQLRDKELQLQRQIITPSPRPTPLDESISGGTPSPMTVSITQDEILEKTLQLGATNGNKTNLYETLRHTGAAAVVEGLESQLKMKEGEIVQLQNEISELERTREAMARELVTLSTQNDLLNEQLTEYPELKAAHKELDGRYQALLQMYGEKVEEAEELGMDLQDIKDMYKAQIEELLKRVR